MEKLKDLRISLDTIDSAIIYLLSERMRLVEKVGAVKKEHNIPPLDEIRWKQVLESKKSLAKQLHLSEEMVEEIYTIIHNYALKLEKEV